MIIIYGRDISNQKHYVITTYTGPHVGERLAPTITTMWKAYIQNSLLDHRVHILLTAHIKNTVQ